MLTINIWKQTKGKDKGSLIGPLYSNFAGGKVGHINLVLNIKDDVPTLNNLKKNYNHLKPVFKSTFAVEKEAATGSLKDEMIYNYRRGKKIIALEFTHSYWPAVRPTYFQTFAGIFTKSIGVKSEFNTLAYDMVAESDPINIDEKAKAKRKAKGKEEEKDPFISHTSFKKQVNQNLAELHTKLNLLLDEQSKHKITKNTLVMEIKDQEDQIVAIENKLNDLLAEYHTITTAFDEEHALKDSSDDKDIVDYLDRIIKASDIDLHVSLEKSIQKLQNELETQLDTLLIKQSDYVTIQERLLDLHGEMEQVQQDIEIVNQQKSDLAVTRGKNPDFVLTLPTDSLQKFSLDQQAILAEMSHQQNDNSLKYRFVNFNCAVAIKKCLIAGITPELKSAMRDMGVSQNFFRASVESPLTVMNWVMQLNKHLDELNSRYEKEAEPIQVQTM